MKKSEMVERQKQLIPEIAKFCEKGMHAEAMELVSRIILPDFRNRARELVNKSKRLADERKAEELNSLATIRRRNMSKPVLQQDDAAPDSLAAFRQKFEEKVGCGLAAFTQNANDTSTDDMIRFESDEWMVCYTMDDPSWALYKKAEA